MDVKLPRQLLRNMEMKVWRTSTLVINIVIAGDEERQ